MFRLTLSVLFLAALAHATQFMNCDDDDPPIVGLEVKGCDKLPCEFPRGKDIIAAMDFTVDSDVTKLKPLVRVKALGMWVEYPMGYDDACEHLSVGECPMAPGDEATYDIDIPVLSSYPKISLDVQVTLKDQDDNHLTCFYITGKVVDQFKRLTSRH